MTVIKCKMCGGDLQIIEGETVAECEYCGTKQTVPKVDDEKKLTLFSRANRLRLACEFDKAASVYESIVADFPEEAEAYWGLVLCRYGIEYVDDPATGRKVPTCHRSSFDSILEDSDFEQACENADPIARRVYRDEAKTIEDIRKRIVEVSGKEPPYDIFICYKETDEKGERTVDSVIAQDVYDALTEKGYRVFFSRITLEDKLGTEYEPYIFAALNSAKLMLAFGTDYEYYNAVWVKNEWSRYLQLMTKDKSKHLIPCFKGIDAYDIPREFAKLQAQDMSKVGAMQDLLRGIDKIMGRNDAGVIAAPLPVAGTAAYTERGFFFLEDRDFVRAADYFERALDQNPRDGRAYLGKIFAGLRVSSLQEFEKLTVNLDCTNDYARAIQFSPASDQEVLLSLKNRMQWKYTIWQLRSVLLCGKQKKEQEEERERVRQEVLRQQEEERRRKEEEERIEEERKKQQAKLRERERVKRDQQTRENIIHLLDEKDDKLSAREIRTQLQHQKLAAQKIQTNCEKLVEQRKLEELKDGERTFYSIFGTEQRREERRLQAQKELQEKREKILKLQERKKSVEQEMASLGFFSFSKKKELQNQLDSIQQELNLMDQ